MSKQKKISTEAAVDRISTFPDDILIRILSPLPIEQAYVTSTLSKRWIHLCNFLPDLDFTGTKLNNQESISRFDESVNSILRTREAAGNHSINTFILDIQYNSSELLLSAIQTIHDWIDIVVKRKVQYLNLYPHASYNGEEETILPKLPMNILNSTTLVVLKLRWFNLNVVNDFSLKFSSLKTLHLKDIYFDQPRDLMMLLDACPVLEDLLLNDIYMKPYPHSYFETSSMLRKLNRANITACDCEFPVKSLSNLEFLRIQLFKEYHPYYDFPTFHNLTHLVLNYDWDIVLQVINHCSKLQNLELYQKLQGREWMDGYIEQGYNKNWVHPEFVPSCLSLNITTCAMRDFAHAGQQSNHIMLASFILKNARVLETMTIWCNSKQSKIESLLSPCPRASATCQLSIYGQHI